MLKNLKLKSTIGADIREYRGEYFRPATIPNNGNVAPLPSTERKATEKSTEVINWLNENTITYFESWGKHELDAVAGVTAQKNIYRYTEATGSDFPNDKIQTLNNATVKSSKSECLAAQTKNTGNHCKYKTSDHSRTDRCGYSGFISDL